MCSSHACCRLVVPVNLSGEVLDARPGGVSPPMYATPSVSPPLRGSPLRPTCSPSPSLDCFYLACP
eukprot:6327338-Alexandrium_andersonii.AAC.1